MAKSRKLARRHVVRRTDGQWAVKGPGSKSSSSVSRTQREAIDKVREVVRNKGGGEVRIHGRNGRIRDSRTISPGNDPYPPKG